MKEISEVDLRPVSTLELERKPAFNRLLHRIFGGGGGVHPGWDASPSDSTYPLLYYMGNLETPISLTLGRRNNSAHHADHTLPVKRFIILQHFSQTV